MAVRQLGPRSAAALTILSALVLGGGGSDGSLAAAQPGPVAVPNGSFEEPGTGDLPTDWTLDPAPRAQTAEASTAQARTGEWSLRIDDPADNSIAIRSAAMPATAEADYTASAWYYAESGDPAWLYLEFFDESGTRIAEQHAQTSAGTGWQNVTVTGVAPVDTVTVDLLVYGSANRAGVSYYDDVSLSEESPGQIPYDPEIGSEKQLFLDDYRIESTERVERVVHQAQKHGTPVLVPDQPWASDSVYLYGTALYDEQDEIFKMWYQTFDRSKDMYHTLYATSEDGVTWEKPSLGLIEYNGSTENNIIGHQHSATVIKDLSDPDSDRRYKMFGMERESGVGGWVGYGVWFSPDGVTWTPSEHNPVLPDGDVANVTYDPRTEQFVATTKHPHPSGRAVFISYSTDFETWSEPELILTADERDQNLAIANGHRNSQIYGMPVIPYEGVYVGFPWMFEAGIPGEPGTGSDGPIDVQMAVSRDLETWIRDDRSAVIPRGIEGSFDSGMNFTPNSIIIRDDRIWMYYGGWDGQHGSRTRSAAIGLASWRVDGFASMANGGYNAGAVTTKPLIFDGDQLVVNADIEGSLRVEVLDESGETIPGFGPEGAVPIARDDVDAAVRWKGHPALDELAGEPIRLRFHLDGGHLYSYQFTTAK